MRGLLRLAGTVGLLGCGPALDQPILAPPPYADTPPAPTPAGGPATTAPPGRAEGPSGLRRAAVVGALDRGPAQILRALEFADRPVFERGRFVGLRLLARRDEGATRSLIDVRPGDVIVRVCGVSPRTPEDLLAAARAVLAEGKLTVELLREGKAHQLEVPLIDP